MNERRLQFQVGLVVLIALSVGTALIVRFGDLRREFEPRMTLRIHLPTSGGLYPSAPVLMHGLSIGRVRQLQFAEEGGVLATVEIRQGMKIAADSRALVIRSLLGETALDILPGESTVTLTSGDQIEGQGASDPLEVVQRLEGRATQVLDSLVHTSDQWGQVGEQFNSLMETKRGDLDLVIERTAESLHQFTQTMQTANEMIAEANKIVADPAAQQALKQTLTSMPRLVEDTRQTIVATRAAVENINRNLVNLAQVTEPVGRRGESMVAHLDSSLKNLDQLTNELNRFAQVVNQPDGTLQKLAGDPSLYQNLDRSAQSFAVLMKNLEPVLKDFREFSDKIARNPELLGVGGAMRPSAGLRDSEVLNPQQPAQRPANANRGIFRSQN